MWVFSLAHLLTKFLLPDTSPPLTSSPFFDIKHILQVQLSYLLRKWLLCLIYHAWHFIIHSKNDKYRPCTLISTFSIPMKNTTNSHWCCFPPRLNLRILLNIAFEAAAKCSLELASDMKPCCCLWSIPFIVTWISACTCLFSPTGLAR